MKSTERLSSSASYISGKIKTSQDGHDECFEKELIVKYVLSHFIGGGKQPGLGYKIKNTPEFTKTVT